EISGQSAGGRRARNHWRSHRALFRHDCDFACRHDRVVGGKAFLCWAFWGMECRPSGGSLLHCAGGNRLLALARRQRSAWAVSSSWPLELPHCIDWSTAHHVGDARLAFWHAVAACLEPRTTGLGTTTLGSFEQATARGDCACHSDLPRIN